MDETVFQPATGGVRPGTRLNGVYEIERLIAQGGMGEVYKGFNIQTGDPVAIKMVRPEMSRNDDVLALFRREASTLHNLQHEAIVRYFVFSLDPDLQRAYLAMEYVDGPSLATRLLQGPLSVAEVGVLFNRIAPALNEAHRLGVIHRDISSDNFILPDGDVRKAKLIDFGIARSNRPNEGTIIGDGFAGKYNYVSPEQLGLAGGEVTGKSDVYSFGLVLAEALRGRPINMGGSQVEIIEKRRKVPDLSDIPAAFRPLLKSMLEPDPANRPASLKSLAAFEAIGQGPPPRGAKPASPRRGGGFLVAAAIVLIVVSLGAVGYVYRDAVTDWLRSAPSKPVVTEPAKPPKLPPLGGETSSPTPPPEVTPPPPPPPGPSSPNVELNPPTPTPPPTPTKTPGLAELLDELPPRAPQAQVSLPPATAGAPYQATLPAFADPGRKGLQLRAETPPEGLNFTDKGDGSSELSGVPSKPGVTTLVITATNHNRRTAKLSATIAVGAAASATPKPSPSVAPPQPITPMQAEVALQDAVAGSDYNAMLPPFSAGPGSKGLALHATPNPPDGLTFTDAGGGFSRLAGVPTRPGAYSFEIVASDSAGGGGRMSVRLVVAPAPAVATPTPSPSVATSPPVTPSQDNFVLDDAVEGREYVAALPLFRAGPNSGALSLHVEPNLPTGLKFFDAGGGLGRLSGKPSRPGVYNFAVIASDATGASAQMSVKLVIAPAPPPAPILPEQANVTLEAAVVGREYDATLPSFRAGPDSQGLALRVEPEPPNGLAFVDAGAGLGRLTGAPTQPGAYRFEVVATDTNGASGRMSVRLVVAPAPVVATPKPSPTVAPPRPIAPSQSSVELDDAVAGRDYNATLPPFRVGSDSQGLSLHTEPNPPDGLTFADAGAGFSSLSGRPSQPGDYDFDVIATDASGARGRMSVKLVIAPPPVVATPSPSPAPPRPIAASQPEVVLDPAVAGRDYNAALPPFRAAPDAQGLALHVEPNPPEGLTFADAGGGFSQLSGKPTRPGAYDFEIIATDRNGGSGQMNVKLVVAPAPSETVAPSRPDKTQVLLSKYSGGPCFFARRRANDGDASIEAVGSDRNAFSRFETAFKHEVGVEPEISAKLIVAAECPALPLMKLSADGVAAAPTIDLTSQEVGSAHPLAGTVRGLAGRRLALLAIDNDGEAHLLPSLVSASGDLATFSVPLSGDAESIGPLQMLLAIASNSPFAVFDHYRPGPVADLAARLRADWSRVGAAADATFFKLTK